MNKSCGCITMEKADNREFNSVGSSRIRVRWLLPYWEEAEEYVIGKKYDVLIFQKVYWASMMNAFEGIKIIDLCDPDWLEGKPVFEFIDKADAVTTSTEALADYVRRLRPNALVKCIPDRVYLPEAIPVKKVHKGVLKTLVWFGYSHNIHYLYSSFDKLILKGIELAVISENPFEPPVGYRNSLKVINIPYNYETLNKDLVKYDAALLPESVGDERAKYKSNNKTLQAKALRMPVVKVPADLERFMSPENREVEADLGRKEVEEGYDVRFSVEEYRQLIQEIKRNK